MVTFSFLIVAWIVLLAIFLWDLIQHGVDKIWMFIVIPATLVLTVTTYTTVQSMLGYPTDKIKEGKFVVISSAVNVDGTRRSPPIPNDDLSHSLLDCIIFYLIHKV